MQHENSLADTTFQLDPIAMQAAPLEETQVPARILVVPWGEVKSTAGSFVVDEESVNDTLAAFREHGTDLPVDYEHQTLGGPYSSPTGLAPAAGWVKALHAISPTEATPDQPPGIWADVEWTPEAVEKLRGKQYRYLSPVALVRREDRRVVGLHSVALTNKPAIVGMPPVVNSDAPIMDAKAAVLDLRHLLLLDESAGDDLILVAAAERIRNLERVESHRQAAARVERAAAAGKIAAAQRSWAFALAARDPAEFDRWEDSAPQIVPLGRTVSKLAPRQDGGARRRAAEQVARAEYQNHRALLEKLCTEEAFVAAALRDPA